MTEKDIEYVESVLAEQINAPKYVKKQCEVYRKIIDDEDEKYCINYDKRVLITEIKKLFLSSIYRKKKQTYILVMCRRYNKYCVCENERSAAQLMSSLLLDYSYLNKTTQESDLSSNFCVVVIFLAQKQF